MWVTRLALFSLLAFALSWLLFGTDIASAAGVLLDPTETSQWATQFAVLTQVAGTETAGWGATYQAGQTITAEWTSQWEPVFASSTAQPTNSYTCPTALAQGWGTLTPEAWWSMNCGQCNLTLTPPAATQTSFLPSNTPDPNVTSTNTATVTSTSTPHSSFWLQWLGSPIEFNTGGGGGIISRQVPILPEHQGRVIGIIASYRQGTTENWTYTMEFDGNGIRGPWYGAGSGQGTWRNRFMWGGARLGDGWEGLPGSNYENAFFNTYSAELNAYGTWAVTYAANFGTDASTDGLYATYWEKGGQTDVVIRGYVYQPLPGTGTPTPYASYCAVVNNGQPGVGGGGIVDVGIELPEFTVGPASCSTFGGWGLDWTNSPPLPAVQFELPSITLCFQPLHFGSFSLFGVAVDMDLFVTIMGAAALLRWALRS